VFFLVLSKLPK